MKATALFAAAAVASAQATPGGFQQFVDAVFEKYVPQKEVSVCVRMMEQCELFNATATEAKACHMGCGHGDFQCHLACPKAKPTSAKELLKLADAMLCHKSCGFDGACHKACKCPFDQKRAACGKLLEVVECHKQGGDHSTCKLDEDAKEFLVHEPWSLVKDVVDHVVDRVLPVPADQQATEEEVRSCHAHCGPDIDCHKSCPTGPWGALKDHCASLNSTKACHQSCKEQTIARSFKKMACHMSCPMSMPSSVEELKMVADHMACHADCGEGEECHKACKPRMWVEKKEKCAEYEGMISCHKGCKDQGHDCHRHCPIVDLKGMAALSLATPAGAAVKQVLSSLII